MDENVEHFIPQITPEGVAGLWLQQHIPTSDRVMQVSLGKVITAMMAEAMHKGTANALASVEQSPTLGAAIATLEADMLAIKRAHEEARRG